MGKQIDPMLKTKLYLLAIGILVLAILLVKGKAENEKPRDTENLPIKETPKEPESEPEPEAEEEPQIKVPIYNGNIRVLIKTDGFGKEVHETVKLASGQELLVQGKFTDENGDDPSAKRTAAARQQ